MTNEITTITAADAIESLLPISAKALQLRINAIQEAMRQVMQKDVHYGTIPGTAKPTLYKAGAEVIALMFNLSTTYPRIERQSLTNGHIETSVVCAVAGLHGRVIAEGVGSCSTMESKYRYRKGEGENTGALVPKEYWKAREANNLSKMQEHLGGKGFLTKKVDGVWYIFKSGGERTENADPADQYNTCLKMAKKRAFVDAILTATAASDIFTQDIEDFGDNQGAPVIPPTPEVEETNKASRASEDEDQSIEEFRYDISPLTEAQRDQALDRLAKAHAIALNVEETIFVSPKAIKLLENRKITNA